MAKLPRVHFHYCLDNQLETILQNQLRIGHKLFCDNARFNMVGCQTLNTISREFPLAIYMLRSTSCAL